MSAPVVPDLAANTTPRKYIWEFDLNNNLLAPDWEPMGGIKSHPFTSDDANLQDDARMSDGGYSRQNKTGTGWNATLTVSRAPQESDTTQYDTVQEFVRDVGEGKLGPSAEVNVRWYEFDPDTNMPRTQAYQGRALVSYNEPNGAPTDNSDATFTLTGQGKLNKISHPYALDAAVPNIDSVDNRAVSTAGGQSRKISGQHFSGTTGVTVAGTAVTNFYVVNDSTLIITTPAKTAGSYALVVTNATGASTTGGTLTYS